MTAILVLSIMSPVAELFPNLYMSWWEPSNGRFDAYLQARARRFVVVALVWSPILFTVSRFAGIALTIVLTVMVVGAFGLRLVLFERALDHAISQRRSSPPRPHVANVPEAIYFIALAILGITIFSNVDDQQWLVVVGVLGIFAGAGGMSRFRLGPGNAQVADVVSRIVFAAAFLLNLYNLARAVESASPR